MRNALTDSALGTMSLDEATFVSRGGTAHEAQSPFHVAPTWSAHAHPRITPASFAPVRPSEFDFL
ncbi:MAG UNVERIFIED_CONTAM: hypothetical protein LVT10_19155 [Anaerolineae bacterium]